MSAQELLTKQTEVIKRINEVRKKYIIPLLKELEDLAEKTGTPIYLNETGDDGTGQTYYPNTYDERAVSAAGDDSTWNSTWTGRWIASSELC